MQRLAVRIETVTDTFADPAQVYAFGIRTVLETATADFRWKQLLHRSEVIADALYRCMGPFSTHDLRKATAAGRFVTPDPELTWRMTSHAIVGVALAITKGELPSDAIDGTIVGLLCMTGIGASDAVELASPSTPGIGAGDRYAQEGSALIGECWTARSCGEDWSRRSGSGLGRVKTLRQKSKCDFPHFKALQHHRRAHRG